MAAQQVQTAEEADRAAPDDSFAKAGCLLLRLSQVHFRFDDRIYREALHLLSGTRHYLADDATALGSETHDRLTKFWVASVLYCTLRLSGQRPQSFVSSGFTLSNLLSHMRFEPIEFFKELSHFLTISSHVIKSIYGDACDALEQKINRLQTNYIHLAVIYQNYEKNFCRFFTATEGSSYGDAEVAKYLRFGWLLFLSLRNHVPGHFVDLMACANGLIAIFVIMIIHMPAQMRKVYLNDSSTFAVTNPRGVNVVSSLCQLYDASELDVKVMIERACSMICSLVESKDSLFVSEIGINVEGIDTEGIMCFKGLMEKQAMLYYLRILDQNYMESYHKQGEIDERSFLSGTFSSINPVREGRIGSQEDFWFNCVKTKYDMSSLASNQKAVVRIEANNLTCSLKSINHKIPSLFPIAVSMATAEWLHTVIVPLPSEPTLELVTLFRSCDTDITEDVIYRAHLLLECVFSLEVTSSTVSNANDISSLRGAWVCQRKLDALKMYYRILYKLCKAELACFRRKNISFLLTNEKFHRCMLACCAEVVLAAHKAVFVAFPSILEPMGISAFDLIEVIGSFIKHEETLPRQMRRHLNSIEEILLETLAWRKGSSMYDSLITVKPHLTYDIHRLGLLGDLMPPLESIKSRFLLSVDTSFLQSIKMGRESATRVRRRELGNMSTSVGFVISSPNRDRPLAFSVSSILKPVSPHTTITTNGRETCAQTVIGLFFQKVLKLCAIRTKLLLEAFKHPTHLMEDVFKLIYHLLHRETQIFFNRHIDQLVICSFYSVCKVKQIKLTFKEIIQKYKEMSQNKSYVFRTVLLNPTEGAQETGNIIQFYNYVFASSAKSFLNQLNSNLAPNYN